MIVGVDIGLRGAVAILDEAGALIAVRDMPTLADGPSRRPAINPALLAALIREVAPARPYVELVGPRPGEGSASAFAFGRARGVVEGVLAALQIPIALLTPPQWKRAVGLPPGPAKDQARSLAIRRWPQHAALFARRKDDGRAEAALIAVAGLTRLQSAAGVERPSGAPEPALGEGAATLVAGDG